MSGSKYFERIAWGVAILTLIVTILFMNGRAFGIEAMAHISGYENRLFDNTKVHTIDIVMDGWDEFIADATSEEYYAANVVIDGEAYRNVGIRGKGNTSLSTVAALGSERYSFKIEFDKYDSSGSYYGLDKLSLNNLIQDSTMMKDYLTYTMMREFGVNTSLCSFVYITVNGADWGLYLAVEGVEEAFLKRNYGSDYGELYKPDSMSFGGGRGNGADFHMDDLELDSASMSDSGEKGGFGFGGGHGAEASDVKLQYIDDEIDSYSNIWNNAKTEITEADQKRLIKSLKGLSVNEDIETIVDVEQVIRYFVVHNYVCNDDSYTGRMVHNYYLYEKDGQLSMIPWDYNLAYGTFGGGNATSTVNTPIDSPVSGGSSDRPMLNWIFEDERYTEMYHLYFSRFIETVDIAGIIDNAYELIKPYVEKDPTAFYGSEEFELGVQTLRQFCAMRSESISMQLENEETAENMNYVDASAITLSDMGSMGGADGDMSGNRGGFGGGMPRGMEGADGDMPGGMGGFGGDMPENMGDSGGGMPGTPGDMDHFDGSMPENMGDSDGSMPVMSENMRGVGGNVPENIGDSNGSMPDMSGNMDDSGGTNPENPLLSSNSRDVDNTDSGMWGEEDPAANGNSGSSEEANPVASGNPDIWGGADTIRPAGGNIQMPGDFPFDRNGTGATPSDTSGWIWIAVSALVLGAGLIIAVKYKY